MVTKRVYRDSFTKEEALNELLRNSGTQFDSNLVEVFINKVLVNEDEIM